MTWLPSISRVFFVNLMLVALVSVVGLSGLFVWDEINEFRVSEAELRREFLAQEKSQLANVSARVFDIIQHERAQAENRLRKDIKDRVYEAHALATHLYNTYHNSMSEPDLRRLIRNALRPIRFNDGRGYYFATNMDGVEELFAIRPSLEGTNMLNVTGARGERVVRDMIDVVNAYGEGYTRYTWVKPGSPGEDYPKIAFVKRFEPYGYFIGTGEYVDDVMTQIRREVLARVDSLSKRWNEQILVGQWNGVSLIGLNRDKSLRDLTMPGEQRSVFDQVLAYARGDGGYLSYVGDASVHGRDGKRMMYVRGDGEWQWYVAVEVYTEEFERQVALRRATLNQGIQESLFWVAVTTALIGLFIYAVARRTEKRTRRNYQRLHRSFHRASLHPDLIDTTELDLLEFREIGESANKMIVARNRAEKAMAAAQLKAEKADQAKSEFLANMSHEIRTPMNAIVGMTDLALATSLNKQQRDYLSKVKRATHSLLGLINDILDFSKIEAGKLVVEHVAFQVDDVLEHVATMVGFAADEKGLEFVIKPHAMLPSCVKGDPLRLEQILVNLCANAVKFTKRGEVVLSLEVKQVSADHVGLAFSVQDTGVGIAKSRLSILFKPFSQADASTTRRYGGTGLGLAITKQLVDVMGGKISVSSDLGQGSLFEVYLEFEICDTEANGKRLVDQGFDGRQVLLVDDNASSRQVLKDLLEGLKLKVTSVETAEAGLALVSAENAEFYDMVLMDYKLPGMNGIDACREIRQLESKQRRAPLMVMVAGVGRDAIEEEAIDAGVNGFITKPVNRTTLFESLAQCLFGNNEPQPGKPGGDVHIPEALQGAKILVVEDNDINQEVAREIIQKQGFEVMVADHGEEAIAMMEHEDFDLVLMDVQMPIMDGYVATRKIRQHPTLKNIPILAMTANAMSGDREKCLNVGMNDHISKPIDQNELFSKMVYWLEVTRT